MPSNIGNSDNYRGIALCSALCKAINILMIERYEHILFTSRMQFAYKRYHSTNMCTTMIKETASYYNSRHRDVFLCTMDASKAIDRVHLGKLFALLHNTGLQPVANRLLLEMYTCQLMCTKWNGFKSEVFATENGVKQGGILSPILFGWRLRPTTIYDEIGAAARNIHCYTAIGFWLWGGSGADSVYWNIACNCLPSHFTIMLVEFRRLGLLGIEMYHGFKRLLNHTDTSFCTS